MKWFHLKYLNMQEKEKKIYRKDKLKYLFYPNTSLILTLIMSIITVILMFIILSTVEKGAIGYDITFALLTGIIASIPIAMAIEMSNNLKNNTLAWYELYEYHKTLLDYKFLNKDQSNTFNYLYKLIPIFKDTLNNKKAFLTHVEIDYLEEIIHEYESIKIIIIDYLKMNIKKPVNKSKGLNKYLSDINYDKQIDDMANDLLNNKESLAYLESLNNEEINMHTLVIASSIEELVKEASKKPVFDIMINRLNK